MAAVAAVAVIVVGCVVCCVVSVIVRVRGCVSGGGWKFVVSKLFCVDVVVDLVEYVIG